MLNYDRALSRDSELGLDVSIYHDRKSDGGGTIVSPMAVDPRIFSSSDSEDDVSTRGMEEGIELPVQVVGGLSSLETEEEGGGMSSSSAI